MTGASVILDLLLPAWLLLALAGSALALIGLSLWRGLRGWWLRGLAALVLLGALANPSLQTEDRRALSDIVVMVVDESASQRVSVRPEQTAEVAAQIEAQIAALPNTELRLVRLGDDEGNAGTLAMTALGEALADEPRGRIAGAIVVTDGQVHDTGALPDLPAPLHAVITGRSSDWDRRLQVRNAPAFAIIGEEVVLTLRIDEQGTVPPEAAAGSVELDVSVGGERPFPVRVPVGQDIEVPLTLRHGGMNVIQFQLPAAAGELTDRNNAAVVQINGIRDRLRVLLVSGEPHTGERTWRNLLKSDASVDLVHFTILRPPEKQDGVPVSELSLIAFPTRELFMEKVDEFDLIIFDRYKRRGLLPQLYLENISQYVREGGALLIAAGPDFASADSIYRSPLAQVLPAMPTARVVEEGFRPEVTELGNRHPVTEGLAEAWDGGTERWGRWFRMIEVEPTKGHTLMSGVGGRPLLMLDRVEEGRVALLASDHAWLWNRGFEGGGPQLELLRRLAHWMMGEPELEEEALTARADGQTMTVTRRSLEDSAREVEITGPDGLVTVLPLEQLLPGQFAATFEAPEIGLYRLSDGTLQSVVGVGPSAPREFEETVATTARMAPLTTQTRGGTVMAEAGAVDIRQVRAGRVAAGRGWLGITPREAFQTAQITINPLAPAWAFLLLAALLSVAAWMREGRSS